MPATRTPIRVRYSETDSMGIVYYGHYLTWLEIGRVEFLRSRGMAYRDLESRGVFLAVRRVECDYLRPARYDDLLCVETSLAETERVRLRFDARILRDGEDAPLAEAKAWLACLGPGRRPVRIPADVAERLRGEG